MPFATQTSKVTQGDTWNPLFTCYADEARTERAKLTGYTIRVAFEKPRRSDLLVEASVTITDAENGEFTALLTPAQTVDMAEGAWVGEVEFTVSDIVETAEDRIALTVERQRIK